MKRFDALITTQKTSAFYKVQLKKLKKKTLLHYYTIQYIKVQYNAVQVDPIDNDPDTNVSSLLHICTFHCWLYYAALHNKKLLFKIIYKCCYFWGQTDYERYTWKGATYSLSHTKDFLPNMA